MLTAQTLHRRAAKVLPQALQTCAVLDQPASGDELAALMFPLRRRSAGSVVFRLSPATVHAMACNPLAFLEDAIQAREGLGRLRQPFQYRPWRCARIARAWLPRSAAVTLGSDADRLQAYFTTKSDGKALLVVVPACAIAAYQWRD